MVLRESVFRFVLFLVIMVWKVRKEKYRRLSLIWDIAERVLLLIIQEHQQLIELTYSSKGSSKRGKDTRPRTEILK